MQTLILIVLWLAVSLLVLDKINDAKGLAKDWEDFHYMGKIVVFVFLPFIYLVIAGNEAFKK